MSKPGAFALTKDAKSFVFASGGLLRRSLLAALLPIVAIGIANMVARMNGIGWADYAAMVPELIVYACFVLTWHRASLLGDSHLKTIHPFNLKKTDFKFLGFFVLLTGIFSAYMAGVDYGLYLANARFGEDIPKPVLLAYLVLVMIGIYCFVRLSFVFPAQSVGVTLKFREILAASKGMAWRLIGASLIYTLLFVVAIVVYRLVLELVVRTSANDTDLERYQVVFMTTFLGLPIQLASFVVVALLTTALSKAYRWGMENNPVA